MADALIFLTLHDLTARALKARIQALLDVCGEGSDAPLIVTDVHRGASADAPGSGGRIIITSTDLDAWAAHAELSGRALTAIYIRSELALLHGAAGALWPVGSREAGAWSQLLGLDLRLSALRTLAAEDVHGASCNLWPELAALLGLPWPKGEGALSAGLDAEFDYGRVLADLAPPLRLGAALHTAQPWIPANPARTCAGGAGLRFLSGGWSSPESDFVWSEGVRAGLRLPASAAEPVAWRLEGSLIGHPQRIVRAAFRANDRLVGVVENAIGSPIEFSIDLPPAADGLGVSVVSIEVDRPVRPSELGAGKDERPLGVALRRVTRRVATAGDEGAGRRTEPAAMQATGRGASDALPFLEDALLMEALGRGTDLAVILSSDELRGQAVVQACRRHGFERVLQLDGASRPGGLPGELAAAQDRVGLVVLCDEGQHEPWLAAVRSAPARFAGTSVILPAGDPYVCPRELLWRSRALNGLVQFSDHTTVLAPEPWR